MKSVDSRKNKVVKYLFSRDFATFSFFLVIAFGLWIMHSTSMKREIKTRVPIKYYGVPDVYSFSENLPTSVSLSIRDEGVELWKYMRNNIDSLPLNLEPFLDGSGNISISSDAIIQAIRPRLASSTQILDINPKNLVGKYFTLHSKQVPFIVMPSPSLAKHHVLAHPIAIEPPIVTIYGDKNVLDSIQNITIPPPNGVISKTKSKSIMPIVPKNIKLSNYNPQVNIAVEMSSEKRISVPITVRNIPDNITFMPFPKAVDISFNIGVSRFNTISSDDFSIELDYNKLIDIKSGRVDISLSKQPIDIDNIKLSHLEIEFILSKE